MKEKEEARLKALKEYELKVYNKGIKYIAGIDEAGRGPLAGPVVIGVVIMRKESFIEGINDSKKISEGKREKLYNEIIKEAIAWSVGIVNEERIDEINILNATKEALTEAISKLNVKPELILVDALDKINTLKIPYVSVIKGDAKIYSISAASIIAKVTRDRIMKKYDEIYPKYNFAKHKGYGTQEHIEAIKQYGLCPIHRKSFTKKFI